MTEEKEFKLSMKNVEAYPTHMVQVDPNIPTLVADYVKCITDHDTKLCTFLFFKKHFIPKEGDKGLIVDRTVDEAFLEIKVPEGTAFALALYMGEVFKEMRKTPTQRGCHFGPSKIEQG